MSKRAGFQKDFLEQQQEDAIAGRQILSPTIKIGEEVVALHGSSSSKEKIQKFEEFLSQSPLLGNNLDNALAKDALEFALHYAFSHPEMIDKIITLITEQNTNNPTIKKALAQRLVEFNNNNASELSSALNIEDHIKKLDPKSKGSQLSSLSSRNEAHIRNIAAKSVDKERMLSGEFSEAELKSFHSSYQAVQKEWTKIPTTISPSIISGIILSTNNYFDKQAKSGDLQAIKNMVAIASKSKAFMGYHDYKDQNNLEERLVLAAAGHIIGKFNNPISEIDTEKLNKFSEFFDKDPVLGRDPVNSPASLGKVAIEMALEHAERHPDLLKKVTGLVLKQNKNNSQAIEEFKARLATENRSSSRTEGQKKAIYGVLKELNKPKISRMERIITALKKFKFSFPKINFSFPRLFNFRKKETTQKNATSSDPMINEVKAQIKETEKKVQKRMATVKTMATDVKKQRWWGRATNNSIGVITTINKHQQQRDGIEPSSYRSKLSREEQLSLVEMDAKNRLAEKQTQTPKPKRFRPAKMVKKFSAFVSNQVSSVTPASVMPESMSTEGTLSSKITATLVEKPLEKTKTKHFRPAKMAKKFKKILSMEGSGYQVNTAILSMEGSGDQVNSASPPKATPVSKSINPPKKKLGIF